MKGNHFLRIIYWLLLVAGPVIVYFVYLSEYHGYPDLVRDGAADLRDYHLMDKTVIPLNGTWTYYPDQLLTPEEIQAERFHAISVEVPATWDAIPNFGRYGYGTYHCRVVTQKYPENMALYYSEVFSASALFINGLLCDIKGRVGTSSESSFPEIKSRVISFPTLSDTTDIVLQLSNFHFRTGGIKDKIFIGGYDQVKRYSDQQLLVKAFLIGGLVIIAFFQLGMALLPIFNRVYYLFAFICLLLAFRLIILPESPVFIVQEMPYGVRLRLEYLTFFLGIPTISAIMNALFPKDYSRIFVYVFFGLGLIFTLVQYFVPVLVASWFIPVFQGVVFAQGLIVTLILVAVILRKRPDAYVFFVGWIMVLAGIVHDILVTSGVMHSGIQITPYLMFLFIFVQANVVARRSSQAFLQVEQLSDRLNFVNLNLEKMVSERTRRIERQNIEMERQTRKIDRQNVELQKTINVRNQVLTIIGHDLRSPIGNISEMVDLLLNDTLDDETQMQILYTIKQAATGSFTLLENLMYWGRAQSGRISNHPELSSLHNSVEEALHLLMPGAREKNITLENSVSPDQMAWCDPVHLNLVFRNLINNAIKFTPEGGRVNISSRILQDKRNNLEFVEVSVRDNGVGIPPEKLEQIFTSDTIESTWGTNNEKGSGIGLQLVKQFITINHGQVYARSKVGEFTAFIFSLPLKETR